LVGVVLATPGFHDVGTNLKVIHREVPILTRVVDKHHKCISDIRELKMNRILQTMQMSVQSITDVLINWQIPTPRFSEEVISILGKMQ
jgi:hypothetical protein